MFHMRRPQQEILHPGVAEGIKWTINAVHVDFQVPIMRRPIRPVLQNQVRDLYC